jgi:hypothetical protein
MRHAIAGLAYTALWLVTRWPAIRENALFFDDFAVPLRPAVFYVNSYRPLVWLEYRFWELLVDGHFWTVLPKIAAAFYVGAAALLFSALLRRWQVPAGLAYALAAVAVANPVLNDAGLWQSLHALPLAIACLTAGVLLWETPTRARLAMGTLLVFAGLNGYQIFASLVLIYLAAEPVIKRFTGAEWRLRDSLVKLGLTAAAGIAQIVEMQVIRAMVAQPDVRGFAQFTSLAQYASQKLHGIFNLCVNGVMPVLAYYAGALAAMSLWKFVPLGIAVAGAALALIRRRTWLDVAIAAVFPVVVFFLPAAPTLLISQSPYAWRVSTPTALALALALAPLLILLRRGAVVVALVIAALMIPPTHYESTMRVVSVRRDAAITRGVIDAWAARGVPRERVTLAYIGPRGGATHEKRYIGPRELTWGYQRITPGMWSPFNNGWFAKYYVENYQRLHFRQCGDAKPEHVPCQEARAACASKRNDGAAIWPRLVHLPEPGVTAVCVF